MTIDRNSHGAPRKRIFRRVPLALCLFAALLAVGFPRAATRADTTFVDAGLVSGHWGPSGSLYVVRGNLEIATAETLDIDPGVTVFFEGPYRLLSRGWLRAYGTESDSVVFTADTVANPDGWAGLRCISGTAFGYFSHTVFEHGRALGSYDGGLGGAVFCDGAVLVFERCAVRYSRGNAGSGLYVRSNGRVTMTDCVISENGHLVGCGGGIACRTGSLVTLRGCVVENNIALYGGGLCPDASTVVIEDSYVGKNTASIWGGGLFCSGADVTMRNSYLSANTSTGGGGIDGRWQVWLHMDRCVVENNRAMRPGVEGPGGAMILQGGEQWISHCTFVGNAALQGGAIYGNTNIHLDNTIFAFHPAGGALHFTDGTSQIRYCCFAGNTGGNFTGPRIPPAIGVPLRVNANGDSCDVYFNIYADPQFDSSSAGRHHLTAGSPCINAGDPAMPRDPDGSVTDIGAFWFDPSSASGRRNVVAAETLVLHPPYPNPFNPVTELAFDLPQSAPVRLLVFDLLGRHVALLADGVFASGRHSVVWNASALGSGTYFAVLESGGFRSAQKLLLLK